MLLSNLKVNDIGETAIQSISGLTVLQTESDKSEASIIFLYNLKSPLFIGLKHLYYLFPCLKLELSNS